MDINNKINQYSLHINSDFEIVRDDGKKITQDDASNAANLIAKEILTLSESESRREFIREKIIKVANKLYQHSLGNLQPIVDAAKECNILPQVREVERYAGAHRGRKMHEEVIRELASGKTKDFAMAEAPTAFPTTSLTRMLTGDVPSQALIGLGRMTQRKTRKGKQEAHRLTPTAGYKDVFVSSLRGIS